MGSGWGFFGRIVFSKVLTLHLGPAKEKQDGFTKDLPKMCDPPRLLISEVILHVTPDGFFTKVPREYIIILNCFRTFPIFAPWPRRMVRGQSGRIQSGIQLACSSPQE